MPHLTLEYTAGLAGFSPAASLARIHEAMLASNLFGEADIKSRALALKTFRIGKGEGKRGFVHVSIALLSGRSDAQRQQLAQAVLAALRPCVPALPGGEVQISVETRELHRESYAKETIHAT